jgi:hypothetical protein
MLKNYLIPLSFVFLFCSIETKAQSISPQSINSNGKKMNQSNGSLSFTVGELVVLTHTDNQGNSLSNGFSSNATLSTLSVEEVSISNLNINVYPNPSSEVIHIDFQNTIESDLSIELIDLKGQVIETERPEIESKTIKLNVSFLPTGSYFLRLKNTDNNIVGNYKLIKN